MTFNTKRIDLPALNFLRNNGTEKAMIEAKMAIEAGKAAYTE